MKRQDNSDTLASRAAELIPLLRERAASAEAARTISKQTISEFRESGFFRILQPRRYEGLELAHQELAEVLFELGQGCASSAWIAGVFADNAVSVASLPKEGQDEIWGGTPDALTCASFAPAGTAQPVDGGFKIYGRWPFASGCDHADWALLGAHVRGPGDSPEIRSCVVRIAELEIIDDWHVIGLAATGSKSLKCDGVFVPHSRTFRHAEALEGETPGSKVHSGPTFKSPRNASSQFTLASIGVGIALGAIDRFIEEATAKKAMSNFANIQLRLAESAAEAEAAREIIRRNCLDNYSTLARGESLSLEQRARSRRDQVFAVKLALQSVDRLFYATGANGMYESGKLVRPFRDLHAASQHLFLNWDVGFLAYGSVRLGVPPETRFI